MGGVNASEDVGHSQQLVRDGVLSASHPATMAARAPVRTDAAQQLRHPSRPLWHKARAKGQFSPEACPKDGTKKPPEHISVSEELHGITNISGTVLPSHARPPDTFVWQRSLLDFNAEPPVLSAERRGCP